MYILSQSVCYVKHFKLLTVLREGAWLVSAIGSRRFCAKSPTHPDISAALYAARDLAQQRQKQTADRIAERHHQYVEQGPQAPRAADRKQVHIRDAVLEAAENKCHDTEKQSQVFADLMLMIFETIDSEV